MRQTYEGSYERTGVVHGRAKGVSFDERDGIKDKNGSRPLQYVAQHVRTLAARSTLATIHGAGCPGIGTKKQVGLGSKKLRKRRLRDYARRDPKRCGGPRMVRSRTT